jgi:prepilin-type N-terminal cleavage/methylation domain-containing protein
MLPTRPIQSVFKPAARRVAGFTMVEMMITMAVVTMIIAGLMSANFLGLREERLMESKCGANESSRRDINLMMYDIRSAKGYDIGTMSGTNFTAITNGLFQGAALKLYCIAISTNEVIDATRYILYYFDTSQAASYGGMLWRFNSTNGASAKVICSNLINTFTFASEDYRGVTQTNVRTFKGVVHATLQFQQFQYPLTAVGTNGLFDYYRIECRATPHIPDGP